MLVLNNSCIWNISLCVIYDCITLIIWLVNYFLLKSYGTIVQLTITVVIKLVDFPCKYNLVGNVLPISSIFKEICASFCFNDCKQAFYQLIIAAYWYTLVFVVEIVIVKNKTDWQTLDDKSRKFCTSTSPLLLCIALYQLFVNVFSYEHLRLFFKITRFGNSVSLHSCNCLSFLFINLCLSFFGCCHAPHLVKRIHVERQIVQLTFIICDRRVCIAVEFNNGIYEIPYLLI